MFHVKVVLFFRNTLGKRFFSRKSSFRLNLLVAISNEAYIDVTAGLRSPSLLDKGPFSQRLLLQSQTSNLQEVVGTF